MQDYHPIEKTHASDPGTSEARGSNYTRSIVDTWGNSGGCGRSSAHACGPCCGDDIIISEGLSYLSRLPPTCLLRNDKQRSRNSRNSWSVLPPGWHILGRRGLWCSPWKGLGLDGRHHRLGSVHHQLYYPGGVWKHRKYCRPRNRSGNYLLPHKTEGESFLRQNTRPSLAAKIRALVRKIINHASARQGCLAHRRLSHPRRGSHRSPSPALPERHASGAPYRHKTPWARSSPGQ